MLHLENDGFLQAVARLSPQWLAGFFDGEGCITGWSIKQPNGDYNPRISVDLSQKDPSVLVLIREAFGGILIIDRRNNNHRLRWNGSFSEPFLSCIKDYVIVKRRQVELALEFVSLIQTTADGVLDRRFGIVAALRDENRHPVMGVFRGQAVL